MQDNWPTKIKIAIAALITIGYLASATIAEFLIALLNRVVSYPTGTDWNLLSKMILAQGIIIIFLALVTWKYFKLKLVIVIPIVILSLIASQFIPSLLPVSWCAQELRIYSCDHFEQRHIQDVWHN